jgi:chaperonin cofactor prefoldin
MPQCSNCDKTQARFKNDGTLCATCFNDHNFGQVKSKDNTNSYTNISMLQSQGIHGINERSQIISNYAVSDVNDDSEVNILEDKKIGELSTTEFMKLMGNFVKPIADKLTQLTEIFTTKINALEKRVDILEKEDSLKSEKISILTSTVTNMQRVINSIDSKERSKNIMISGLSEEDIRTDTALLPNDLSKVNLIFKKIGIDDTIINNASQLQRIGKDPNNEKRRFLKVTLPDYNTREQIIKNAHNLKNLNEPWNKIFINRDNHPVYQKEHHRLRKKFNELKRNLSNAEDVKLLKGELIVDGVVVDRNLFLK